MVLMDAGKQHHVDLAEARVVGPGDGEAGIVQEPLAVGRLENYRPVAAAELAVDAADGGDLYVGGGGRFRAKPDHRNRDGG